MAQRKRNFQKKHKKGYVSLIKGRIVIKKQPEGCVNKVIGAHHANRPSEKRKLLSGYVSLKLETSSSKGIVPVLKMVHSSSDSVSLFIAGGSTVDEMVANANAAIAKKHGL